MSLFGDKIVSKPWAKATNGKVIHAQRVFACALEHISGVAVARLQKTAPSLSRNNVRWVLTVPAIWNDGAKQVMREAARDAKMFSSEDQLVFVLEAEAAAFSCRKEIVDISPDAARLLKPGCEYLLLDCGSGTVDTVVHRLRADGTVSEVAPASGGDWGSSFIDLEILQFFDQLFGGGFMVRYAKSFPSDYAQLRKDIEAMKIMTIPISPLRNSDDDDGDNLVSLRMSMSLIDLLVRNGGSLQRSVDDYNSRQGDAEQRVRVRPERGTIIFSAIKWLTFFKAVVERIAAHTTKLLNAFHNIQIVFLIGGFASSAVLAEKIEAVCSAKRVMLVTPPMHSFAVIKGAVMYGLNTHRY